MLTIALNCKRAHANVGPDFIDRCAKSGDVTLDPTEGSVSSGKADCKVDGLMNTGKRNFR